MRTTLVCWEITQLPCLSVVHSLRSAAQLQIKGNLDSSTSVLRPWTHVAFPSSRRSPSLCLAEVFRRMWAVAAYLPGVTWLPCKSFTR